MQIEWKSWAGDGALLTQAAAEGNLHPANFSILRCRIYRSSGYAREYKSPQFPVFYRHQTTRQKAEDAFEI
jgi:hypothetical protein